MNVLYGEGLLMRTANRSLNVAEKTTSLFKRATKIGVGFGVAYATFKKNKKTIVSAVKGIKNIGKEAVNGVKNIINIIKK